uniref:Bifunctional lysine-specific demethylase and histidyl-hydroxylase n=1 Tax=Aureoumbra lagunensis TaxID=44058 RepID=A0A7S3JR28_9STRA|mmetsp:Transcript_7802/g.10885  ORF Transcript_7802/g.10885 Transcript_7802/m.10885 type:complete len:448 (+) Transcript_7802:111-1454(+)|eukprot:CAMPEP_0197295656 /NCGR_PEP_ID=MMETSP0890-20130614/36159_1 /TAXON_ID=44058 ORGANISM="Aureoumbra lagunensis, Strain CCMP1510" /NCGR_SAMPLE_ID=MMETSP0890 /ASSEMBLY_ACC=CAM_ASM_000533 /LENGTH=447 /DNA_ID=CAMNT_0042771757 /DNA_START=79 /DNA_END=1422 /DNA_ORIENTATION=-
MLKELIVFLALPITTALVFFKSSTSIRRPAAVVRCFTVSEENNWHEVFGALIQEDVLWTAWRDRMPMVFRGLSKCSELNVGSAIEHDGSIVAQAARVDFDLNRGVGWMNQAIEREAWSEVESALEEGTVLFNSAGLAFPQAAWACAVATQILALPVGGNIYLTNSGIKRSAPAHSDRQDVFAVQISGYKHWRVAKPPALTSVQVDPFARGKGDDILHDNELDWVLDLILEPGDVLFIPAGCPHETSTAFDFNSHNKLSTHLTLGAVSGSTWGLSYLTLARLTLSSVDAKGILDDRLLRRDSSLHDALHQQLPLGTAGRMLSQPSSVEMTTMDEKELLFDTISRSPELSRVFCDVPEDTLLSAFQRIRIHHADLLVQMQRAYNVSDWAPNSSFAGRLDTHIDTLAVLIDNLYDWSLPSSKTAAINVDKRSKSKRRKRVKSLQRPRGFG